MTTPVANARAALLAAETSVRNARGRLEAAIRDRDAAIARGDKGAAEAIGQQIATLDAQIPSLEKAYDLTAEELTVQRTALLHSAADPFALLDARWPLLLLPIRLETRFAWQDPANPTRHTFVRPVTLTATPVLLVRVFPDDVHADAHDPALIPGELELLRAFLERVNAGRDRAHFVSAWEELTRAVGPKRAAWIARCARSGVPQIATSRWGHAPRAALLPDLWLAQAQVGDQTVSGAGTLVREPLDVGPDPQKAVGGADGLAWMLSFAEAQKAGMALTMTLPPVSGTPHVDRLVVVGAHVSRDPATSGTTFEELLDAHHFTSGLSFVRPGAATNALPGTRTDHTSRPSLDEAFAVEGEMWPLVRTGQSLVDDPAADGNKAARLLGVAPSIFGHVEGADRRIGEAAHCTRYLLSQVAYKTLHQLWTPVLAAEDLDEARAFFADAVEGLGPIPALRVGDQPYGILPVGFVNPGDLDLSAFESRLAGLLSRFRSIWETAEADVPRIGGPAGDQTAALLALLRSDGVVRNLSVRSILGPLVAQALLPALDPGRISEVTTARQAVGDLLAFLSEGQGHALPPVAQTLLLSATAPITVPFVQPDDPSEGRSAHEYLDQLSFRVPSASMDLRQLIDPGPFSGSLLCALTRTALLTSADDVLRVLLRDEGVADDQMLAAWDSELDRTQAGPTALYRLEDRFGVAVPAHPVPLVDLLLTAPPPGSELFLAALGAVRELAWSTGFGTSRPRRHPPELLEAVLRSELGLLSHRLDAWITALATERLRRLRTVPGRERGLTIGAYGLLLDLRGSAPRSPVDPAELPKPEPGDESREVFRDPGNAGYVHAPSVGHAATAAVLRSVHLAHQRPGQSAAAGEAFSVDLSSRRVRTALTLLDGIREGQPLAALLGYRIERTLRSRAPQGIAVVRRAAPLAANKLAARGPVEQVAASNVVDALQLIAVTGTGDASAVRQALQPHFGALSDPEKTAVVSAVTDTLADAREAVDAVADVLLSEGVYQLVRGNPMRSAASADALSGAGNPPPEPEVIAQPRTGAGLTLRAAVALPADGPAPADQPAGWTITPRATLEPTLERWARAVLPDPATIRVTFTGAATTTLAQLQRTAVNEPGLRLSALDFVASGQPALEARLLAMARLTEPATALLPSESLAVAMEAAAILRELLTAARPLAPGDFAVSPQPEVAAAAAIARVDELARTVTAVRDGLKAAGDRASLVTGLLTADRMGATNAVPVPGSEIPELKALAAAVTAELTARLGAYDALPEPPADDGPARAVWAYERARAVIGPTGWVVPALDGRTTALFASGVPAGVTPSSVSLVVAQRARVRPGVARLDRLLGCVEALWATVPRFAVTQRPIAPGERWVALRSTGSPTLGGRVSVLAYTPFPDETGTVAGLLIDDWTEVVPSTHEVTSLAFHYNAPTSAAPNVALLGVPQPNAEQWSTTSALAMVEEAIAIARLRAVDPHFLPTTGQILPALMDRTDAEPGLGAGLSVNDLTKPS